MKLKNCLKKKTSNSKFLNFFSFSSSESSSFLAMDFVILYIFFIFFIFNNKNKIFKKKIYNFFFFFQWKNNLKKCKFFTLECSRFFDAENSSFSGLISSITSECFLKFSFIFWFFSNPLFSWFSLFSLGF